MNARTVFHSKLASVLLSGMALAVVGLLLPAQAEAQETELTFSLGALLGDDVNFDFDLIDEARAGFDNTPMYGGRVGFHAYPLGVEGSVLYSPSGLTAEPSMETTDVEILYVEGNVVLTIIPGPIGPFVTGGVGLHRFTFPIDGVDTTESAFGWNWGGGIKIGVGPIVIRGEVRDHVTKFDEGTVADLLGVSNTFHNWEVSAGIGVRF